MIKLSNTMKINGELSMRRLSKKADYIYSNTDPLKVYEVSKDNFSIRSCFGNYDNLTFEQVQERFEDIAEDFEEDIEK